MQKIAMALLLLTATACTQIRTKPPDRTEPSRLRSNSFVCLSYSAMKIAEHMIIEGDQAGFFAMVTGPSCFLPEGNPEFSSAHNPIGEIHPIVLYTPEGLMRAYTLRLYTGY